jgi:hypothetical protein
MTKIGSIVFFAILSMILFIILLIIFFDTLIYWNTIEWGKVYAALFGGVGMIICMVMSQLITYWINKKI